MNWQKIVKTAGGSKKLDDQPSMEELCQALVELELARLKNESSGTYMCTRLGCRNEWSIRKGNVCPKCNWNWRKNKEVVK